MLIKILQARKKLTPFGDWKITQKKISKVFSFSDFNKAIGFVNRVSKEAEKMKHHPDINIRYNKVKIFLSTHSEGGITNKDIDMAQRIEKIVKGNHHPERAKLI